MARLTVPVVSTAVSAGVAHSRAVRRAGVAACCTVVIAAACAVMRPAPLHGQNAPVFLEPGHWSYHALRRLSAAGLTPAAADPAAAPVTVQHARRVFAAAADSAGALGLPGLAGLAAGYRDLINSEADTAGWLAGIAIGGGWRGEDGAARAGDGYFVDEDWQGAQLLRSTSGPTGELRAHGHALTWLAWTAHGRRTAAGWAVPAASVSMAAGAFDVWAGRRHLHYGAGYGGGTVLGTGLSDVGGIGDRTYATFDGLGFQVREPFRLPSLFGLLGAMRIEAAAGRIPVNGRVESPFVAFGRLTGTPFSDRWMLGVNRGAIFGGDGNPVTADRLLGLLIGLHGGDDGEFENQVFSIVSRFRPPLGPLGLELYAEVGMDDTAGAITAMPGIIAGFDVASVPGVPALALGLEHAQYPRSCCGNPIWYRSIFFRGSWADEGRLFAHPLGGHGREWRVYGNIDLPHAGAALRVDAFARRRGHENLFAPEREGRSQGGSIGIVLLPGRPASRLRGLGLSINAGLETADGWDASRLSAILSYTPGTERR